MAKGNSYWSTNTGRLGNIVSYNRNGQHYERKYQPVVYDPKTFSQMPMRILMTVVVFLFRFLTKLGFSFVFYSKEDGLSNYNAFCKENMKLNCPAFSKEEYKSRQYIPFDSIYIIRNTEKSSPCMCRLVERKWLSSVYEFAGANIVDNHILDSEITVATATANILSHFSDLSEGDKVTFCTIVYPNATKLNSDFSGAYRVIDSFTLSSTDETSLSEVLPHVGIWGDDRLMFLNGDECDCCFYPVKDSSKGYGSYTGYECRTDFSCQFLYKQSDGSYVSSDCILVSGTDNYMFYLSSFAVWRYVDAMKSFGGRNFSILGKLASFNSEIIIDDVSDGKITKKITLGYGNDFDTFELTGIGLANISNATLKEKQDDGSYLDVDFFTIVPADYSINSVKIIALSLYVGEYRLSLNGGSLVIDVTIEES